MAKSEIIETAMSGWRLLARRPGRLMSWWLYWFVTAAVMMLLDYYIVGPFDPHRRPAIGPSHLDALQIARSMMVVGLLTWGLQPVRTLFMAVLIAGVARTALGLEPRGGWPLGAGLSVGWVEVRLGLAMFALQLAGGFIYGGVTTGAFYALGSLLAGESRSEMFAASTTMNRALVIAYQVVTSYLTLRLALCAPFVVTTKRLNWRRSWRATRSWPAFAAIGLGMLMAGAVSWAAAGAVSGLSVALGGKAFWPGSPMTHDLTSLNTLFSPQACAFLVVGSLSTAAVFALIIAPAARIFRNLPDGTPADVFG